MSRGVNKLVYCILINKNLCNMEEIQIKLKNIEIKEKKEDYWDTTLRLLDPSEIEDYMLLTNDAKLITSIM